MACVSTDLDCALSYALQRLGTPNLILKPEQRSVIESICINGKDTFVWLPTGFGKSICCQTLPFVFDKMSRKCAAGGSVVVVVSPLISLMEDQVAYRPRVVGPYMYVVNILRHTPNHVTMQTSFAPSHL